MRKSPLALLLLASLLIPGGTALATPPVGDEDTATAELAVDEWDRFSRECRSLYLLGLAAGIRQARSHYGAIRHLGSDGLVDLSSQRHRGGAVAGLHFFLDGIDRRLSRIGDLDRTGLDSRLQELQDTIDALGSGDRSLGVSDVALAIWAPRAPREPATAVELMSLPERERWIRIFLDMGLTEAQAREQARKILERKEEERPDGPR